MKETHFTKQFKFQNPDGILYNLKCLKYMWLEAQDPTFGLLQQQLQGWDVGEEG